MVSAEWVRIPPVTANVREKLAKMERSTINPQSDFLKMWDMVIIAALIFTAVVTPFEVSSEEN